MQVLLAARVPLQCIWAAWSAVLPASGAWLTCRAELGHPWGQAARPHQVDLP